jgi:hypothetical protein
MTLYEEPPIVDLDELLDEQEPHRTDGTRTQWVLVAVGAAVGIAGLLALLVTVAPAILDLVTWVNQIQQAVGG